MSKDFEQLRTIQSQLTPLETLAAKKDSQAARAAERIADPTSSISTIRRSAFILENIGPRQAQITAELEAIRSAKAAEISAKEKEVDSLAPYEHIPSVRAAIERLQAELDSFRTPLQAKETESAEITLIEDLPALPTPSATQVAEHTTAAETLSPIEEPSDEQIDVHLDVNDTQTDLTAEPTNEPLDESATHDLPAPVTNPEDSADTANEPDDSSTDVHDSEPEETPADLPPGEPEFGVSRRKPYIREKVESYGVRDEYVLPTGEKLNITKIYIDALNLLEKGITHVDTLAENLYPTMWAENKQKARQKVSSVVRYLNSRLKEHDITIYNLETKGPRPSLYSMQFDGDQEKVIRKTVLEESNDSSVITNYEAAVIAVILGRKEVTEQFIARGIPLFHEEWIAQAQDSITETSGFKLSNEEMDQLRENIIKKLKLIIEEGKYNEVARNSGKSVENLLTYCTLELDGMLTEAFGIILKQLEEDKKRPRGKNGVRATMVAGGINHVTVGNGDHMPPTAVIHRFTKEAVSHEPDIIPSVAPIALESITAIAATPEEPATPEPTDTPAENEDDVIGAQLTQAETSEEPTVAVIDIPAAPVAVETKKEQNKEPRPDLFDKDPEYAARIETALTQILATFTDLEKDARLQITGRQVTGAGGFRIAFKNKAESSGYIVVLGSKSKELYTTEALVMLSYLREHHPKFNFSPAAKRQLRDYIHSRVEDLIISQQLIKKKRNENGNGGGK